MRPSHLLSGLALGLSFLAAPSIALAQSSDTRVLNVAAPWEIVSVDPATDGSILLKMQIGETLVDADASGKLLPGLATAWTASEDGLTWRFTLREGVTFHDGSPITADAVATALERARSKPGPFAKTPATGVSADGDAVQITLSEPFGALPAFLAHSSTLILAPSSFDGDAAAKAIGTGPYAVDAFAPPLKLTVVRNANYWGDAATIERAAYNSTSRAETRALLAESGDADLVFTLDPSGVAQLASVENVTVQSVPIPRVILMKTNAAHPFLSDPKARQALSLAIDRAGIAAGILRTPEAAANQIFAPVLASWHDAELAPAMRDAERAKALLAELGWTAGDDGMLMRDGKPFKLTMRTFPDRPELPLIAAAIQAQLKEVGIDLELSVGSFSEIPAGHQDGSLELALFARNFGLTPDPVGAALTDYADGGGDWGAMNWTRPDVTAALKTIAADADPAARAQPIRMVTKAMIDDLPVIPITWYQHTVVNSDRIENLVIDPLERSYYLSKLRWAK